MNAVDPYLTCQQLAEFLGEYYDGTLAAKERREFERHLAVCPPCIHYLESYKTTVALGKASCGSAPASEQVPEELIQAILAARRQRQG